jgi:hypothetical protein
MAMGISLNWHVFSLPKHTRPLHFGQIMMSCYDCGELMSAIGMTRCTVLLSVRGPAMSVLADKETSPGASLGSNNGFIQSVTLTE